MNSFPHVTEISQLEKAMHNCLDLELHESMTRLSIMLIQPCISQNALPARREEDRRPYMCDRSKWLIVCEQVSELMQMVTVTLLWTPGVQATSNMKEETKQHESDDNNSPITSREVNDLMLTGFIGLSCLQKKEMLKRPIDAR